MTTKKNNHAKEQARAKIETIVEMLKALDVAENDGIVIYEGYNYNADNMRELIDQSTLSVQVRSGWHTPGNKDNGPEEYKVLLCTGGPAVQIVGELGQFNEPDTAQIQYQDWFEPWEDYLETTLYENAAILRYCHMFYYGE